jgi:hypothetical protein
MQNLFQARSGTTDPNGLSVEQNEYCQGKPWQYSPKMLTTRQLQVFGCHPNQTLEGYLTGDEETESLGMKQCHWEWQYC